MPDFNHIPDSVPSTPSTPALSSGPSQTGTPRVRVQHGFASGSPVSYSPALPRLTLQASPRLVAVDAVSNLDIDGRVEAAVMHPRLLLLQEADPFLPDLWQPTQHSTTHTDTTVSSAESTPGLHTPGSGTPQTFSVPHTPVRIRAQVLPTLDHPAVMLTVARENGVEVNLSPLTSWYARTARPVPDNFETAWRAMPSRSLQIFMQQLHVLDTCTLGRHPAVASQVTSWLDALTDDEVLRRQTLRTSRELAHWGGRGPMVLHALQRQRTQYEAATGVYDYQLPSLIEAARRDFRLMELERLANQHAEALRNSANAPVDTTDVYLALRLGLDRELALGLGTESGNNGRLSSGDWLDLQAAAATLLARENEDFDQYLLQGWTPWQQTMQRVNPSYAEDIEERIAERKDELNHEMQTEMERLMDEKPDGWLDIVTDMKNRFEHQAKEIEREVRLDVATEFLKSRDVDPALLGQQRDRPVSFMRTVL